ncbi:MAG: filamentous hemagglutinin N-terminal domain-containing protein, partial [Alphaproteobacteria bacterium]|nr:filamentous hemagglutinin N-terminal domain-containing protein [Alphaproteobacteria bacterium]
MVAIAALLSLAQTGALAAPVGGQVATGAASITANGAVTTVLQASDRAVIDWSSFNLAAGETARFIVPNSSSATLNRIVGGGVSTISGTVESNGVVYFSNPNGLVFDASSRVMANGFLATSGAISTAQFMSRSESKSFGTAGITLNGMIVAPAITARAAKVTVGGTLTAGSGRIDLASTGLTVIGQGAVISADGGGSGNAGTVRLWSDGHTDFLGRIKAQGSFVEVSGKQSLNFRGTVDTRAAGGKAGTLLLDPATIEIVTTAGFSPAISYITVADLVTALSTNNVIIDANGSTTSGLGVAPTLGSAGSGTITLVDDVTATVGAFSLTLTGSQIFLRANLGLVGGLSLNSSRASVWQELSKSITAESLTGSSVDGFILNGANHFASLGAITNRGSGGISVTNAQALTMGSGVLDGGAGRVAILVPGFDLTLVGPATVKGRGFRLDVGSAHILGGQTIAVSGGDAFVTSALVGNSAELDLGAGDLVFVIDRRASNAIFSFTNNDPLLPDFPLATSGLTVTTTGSTVEKGVVSGGVVFLEGVTTGPARDLRYIEG